MTEQQLERLSALLDASLENPEIYQEINKLIKNTESHDTWYGYHLIGDVMRQEVGPVVDPELAAKISRRLEHEPVVLAPSATRTDNPKSWTRTAAGFAVAASVAVLAVTLAPYYTNPQHTEQATETMAQQSRPHNIYVAEDGTRWDLLQKPKVESRLNSYLVNHQEYAPAGNMKGIMPYASFVSYDGGQ